MVKNVKVDALLFGALKVRTRFAPWSLDNRVPYLGLSIGKMFFSFVTVFIPKPWSSQNVNHCIKVIRKFF